MSLDVSNVLAQLDAYEDHCTDLATRGLRAGAQAARNDMATTAAHGDSTGATRAGYRAYVVTPADDGQAAIGGAIAAVEDKNPGHGAALGGRLGAGSIGVVITCPTDYQELLETENAGLRAVLGPTLDAYRDALTARAARGQ